MIAQHFERRFGATGEDHRIDFRAPQQLRSREAARAGDELERFAGNPSIPKCFAQQIGR
jgi:hypothetical protein